MDPEHESIREQMRADFKASMLGLTAQRNAMNKSNQALTEAVEGLRKALETFQEEMTTAFDAQADLLQGWMERTDTRLGTLLESDETHDARLDNLEARIDALEKRIA